MKISVIIPVHNGRAHLENALRSVWAQGRKDLEVIVVDDGSTDGTHLLLRKYQGRIRSFHQRNKGVAAARNQGIRVARGSLIAFLDADDQWLPGKLDHQLSLLALHPGAVLVSTGAKFFTEKGRPGHVEDHSMKGRLFSALTKGNFIVTSSVMVKKSVLKAYRTPFPEGIRYGEDYVLWLRLASRYDLLVSPEIYVRYRQGSDGEFLGKYKFDDISGVYRLILREVKKKGTFEETKRVLSRFHFELAALHARGGQGRSFLRESWAGIEANPWDPSNLSWCLRSLLKNMKPRRG